MKYEGPVSQTDGLGSWLDKMLTTLSLHYLCELPLHSTRFSKGKLNSLLNVFAYLI